MAFLILLVLGLAAVLVAVGISALVKAFDRSRAARVAATDRAHRYRDVLIRIRDQVEEQRAISDRDAFFQLVDAELDSVREDLPRKGKTT